MIIRGERDLHLARLPGFRPHQLILEAGNKAARSDLQGIIFPFPAFKRFTVDKALKVQRHQVPLSHSCTLRRVHQFRLPFAHLIDVFVHLCLGNFFRRLLHLEPLVLAQRHFRLRRHRSLKDEGFSLFHCDPFKLWVSRQL